jgi:RNA polymerase sigma factor (sigma-70 family)
MSSIQPRTASEPESLFLASLPVIERITGILGRRHALADSEIEEFGSWARAKLIEAEYAVFRKYEGRSALGTYLSVVLANLFRDFRNSQWGRWRPSAAARRLGPLAMQLESLLYRDGHPAREAIEVLKARGAPEAELRTLVNRIPARLLAREVALDTAVEAAPATGSADASVQTSEAETESAAAERAIGEALATLEPEDGVIIRMRYWDDFSVAEIARILGLEQKPLYRRLEAIQGTLGAALVARGIDRTRVGALLSREGAD